MTVKRNWGLGLTTPIVGREGKGKESDILFNKTILYFYRLILNN